MPREYITRSVAAGNPAAAASLVGGLGQGGDRRHHREIPGGPSPEAPLPKELRLQILRDAMSPNIQGQQYPCIFQYLCANWGFCIPSAESGPPNANGTYPQPLPAFAVYNAIDPSQSNPLRIDQYTRHPGGNLYNYALSCHHHVGSGNTIPHIRLPVHVFMADVATQSRQRWAECMTVLCSEPTVVMYEYVPRLMGQAPAAGMPDMRYFEFEAFMVSPCKEQDWSANNPPTTVRSSDLAHWRGTVGPWPVPAYPATNDDRRNMRAEPVVSNTRVDAAGNARVLGGNNALPVFNPGEQHRLRTDAIGLDALGRTIDQRAADFMKQSLAVRGGPDHIFLGPCVQDRPVGTQVRPFRPNTLQPFELGGTRWEARLRGPVEPTRIDWSKLSRTKTLMLDFWHVRSQWL